MMFNYTTFNIFIVSAIICMILLYAQNVLLLSEWYDIKRRYQRTIRPLYFKANYVRKEKRGTNMALVYELTCLPPVDHDVVERRLTVKVNGDVKSTDVYSSETTNLGEKTFIEGDNVLLTLVDVDDVGNVSEPAVVEFVAADTLPPAMPGFSVTLVRELPPVKPEVEETEGDEDVE
jgi:hypothetical protein